MLSHRLFADTNRKVIVIDPSYISKSGKMHNGCFWFNSSVSELNSEGLDVGLSINNNMQIMTVKDTKICGVIKEFYVIYY